MVSSPASATASALRSEDAENQANATEDLNRGENVWGSANDKDSAPCSDLYDLVLEMRWYWAAKHVERRPQDAAWQDGDSLETPLHLACQNQPPARLVKDLIKAYPQAAVIRSYKMRYLPLHLACRYNASIEVLRELLTQHPATAASESKYGTTALHSLIEGRDTIANTETEDYRTLFWQKVDLLLRSIARTRGGEDFLLHAAVSIGSLHCPKLIINYCLDQHGHLVRRRDSTGRLPLHLAVGPARYSESSRRRYKPREQHVLHRLLEIFPEAAREQDPNECLGRMPLHSALLNGHIWFGGVKELFEAAPELALIVDPDTNLYPFQLSWNCDTIFRLLRASPCVLASSVGCIDSTVKEANQRQIAISVGDDQPERRDIESADAQWTSNCFLGAFVAGAAVSLLFQIFPFVQNDRRKFSSPEHEST